jgi:hypothetical protein
MLFVPEDDAAKVWKTVCHAVADNFLGIAAKIATYEEGKVIRLICVYTKDFDDMADVRRVALELQDLKLLPRAKNRFIYYKCDAYTHLDIMSDNEYGLAASLYCSKDILRETTPEK